jgi:CubicO group peptidase (beta-lactamase class C family)
VTGGNAGAYAREKLFDPIGMSPVDWWTDSIGQTATYCCIDTPARQFAKFGLLYLRGGAWDGTPVVPGSWVTTSTSPSVVPYYGYQWWLDVTPGSREMYIAIGFDGQYIYVVPALDLVVVRNGHYDKYPGEPRADPSLWSLLPGNGLVEGLGSVPPDEWDDGAFLAPIEASIE